MDGDLYPWFSYSPWEEAVPDLVDAPSMEVSEDTGDPPSHQMPEYGFDFDHNHWCLRKEDDTDPFTPPETSAWPSRRDPFEELVYNDWSWNQNLELQQPSSFPQPPEAHSPRSRMSARTKGKSENKLERVWVCELVPCPGAESDGSHPIFVTSHDLASHYNEVHPSDASERFSCPHPSSFRSGNDFKRSEYLRGHLLKKHSKVLAEGSEEGAGSGFACLICAKEDASVQSFQFVHQLVSHIIEKHKEQDMKLPQRAQHSTTKRLEVVDPSQNEDLAYETRDSESKKQVKVEPSTHLGVLDPKRGLSAATNDGASDAQRLESEGSQNSAAFASTRPRESSSTAQSSGQSDSLSILSGGASSQSSLASNTSDLTAVSDLNIHARAFVEELAHRIARRCLEADKEKLRRHPEGHSTGGGTITQQHTGNASGKRKANSRKRGRASNGDNGNNNGDDNNDDDGSSGPRKKQCLSKEFWACPYTKFDPLRYSEHNQAEKQYRKCRTVMLMTISQLKQHLRRNLREPRFFCGNCYQDFEKKGELIEHNREECPTNPPRFQEMMTEEQYSLIPAYLGNDERSWKRIFRILFGEAPIPELPYATLSDASKLQHFIDLFQLLGPPECLALLWSRLNSDPRSLQFNTTLRVLIEETIEIAFPEYHDMLQMIIANPPSQELAAINVQGITAQVDSNDQTTTRVPQDPDTIPVFDPNCYAEAQNWMSTPSLLNDAFYSVGSEQLRQLELLNQVQSPVEEFNELRASCKAG